TKTVRGMNGETTLRGGGNRLQPPGRAGDRQRNGAHRGATVPGRRREVSEAKSARTADARAVRRPAPSTGARVRPNLRRPPGGLGVYGPSTPAAERGVPAVWRHVQLERLGHDQRP